VCVCVCVWVGGWSCPWCGADSVYEVVLSRTDGAGGQMSE